VIEELISEMKEGPQDAIEVGEEAGSPA
jgi:hypothetical protein